ncbi:TniB family NTP-binding protein [Planctobacterium marinum]|uniref:Transposase n=1 Tax=Planctobacterium marinum TaxID=1631968 RepID=A0AA48HSU6_9ALTE|nr:transposase [Planctobacterium marinum]
MNTQNSVEELQKLKEVKELYIDSPLLKTVKSKMQSCLISKGLPPPKCMLITGDTGAGKTTLIKQFIKAYPSDDSANRSKIPILHTTLPENATPKTASQQLLSDLGDPLYFDGNDPIYFRKKIATLLKETDTQLIFLDEFQHMIERNTGDVISRTTDWLKLLIELTEIPIILSGMPYCEMVLRHNSQLSERVFYRITLPPFRVNDPKQREYYLIFLTMIDKNLPFKFEATLTEGSMPKRLYAYSNGNMRKLKSIISEASEIAIFNDDKSLKLEHFKEAAEPGIDNENCATLAFHVSENKLAIKEPGANPGWEDFLIRRTKASAPQKLAFG